MRIGIFSDDILPHISGISTSVFHQQRALKQAGHEVHVISTRMRGPVPAAEHENIFKLKPPVSIWYDGMELYLYPRQADMRRVDQLQLDVVHVETEANVGVFGAKYAKQRQLPLLYTAHTFLTPQMSLLMPMPQFLSRVADWRQRLFLGKFRPRFEVKPVDGLLGIPCNTGPDRRELKVWMHFAGLADAIIAPSQRMVDYVDHYVKSIPKYCIPNPFASPVTDSHQLSEAHQPLRLISTSVLRPEKRVDIIPKAVALLTPEERQHIKVDIYGGDYGHHHIKAELEAFCRQHQLESVVQLHGSVDNIKVQHALDEGDILISTSVGFDNQPMTILEAVHAGLGIIHSDPYLKEATSGDNGLLVEQSAEGLAKGLRQLIHNPDKVSAMKKASKQVAKKYAYSAYVEKFERVLKDLGLKG